MPLQAPRASDEKSIEDSDMTYQSISPNDGKVLQRFDLMTAPA